jgi:PEP-CTERM motif
MFMKTWFRLVALAAAMSPAYAGNLMPSLSTVPAGWTVDRYAPSSFSSLGTVNGENNVLGIGIGPSGDSANRAYGFDSTFYNTQGEAYTINGGAGDDVAVYLYIPESWSDAGNGDVRTDLWVDTSNQYFAILGFTNFGTNNRAGDAGGTFEYWDDNGAGWTAVSAPVLYGQWNSLDVQYTGSAFNYLVNGAMIGSVTGLGAADAPLTEVLLEAYNYNDPNFGAYYGNPVVTGNQSVAYTAEFANVPDPATLCLIGGGLIGIGLGGKRLNRIQKTPLSRPRRGASE